MDVNIQELSWVLFVTFWCNGWLLEWSPVETIFQVASELATKTSVSPRLQDWCCVYRTLLPYQTWDPWSWWLGMMLSGWCWSLNWYGLSDEQVFIWSQCWPVTWELPPVTWQPRCTPQTHGANHWPLLCHVPYHAYWPLLQLTTAENLVHTAIICKCWNVVVKVCNLNKLHSHLSWGWEERIEVDMYHN